MSTVASQITSLMIVYSTVYSGADQRKHQSSTGLHERNSPVTGKFPSQRASNAENVSIWWRHHAFILHWWSGQKLEEQTVILSHTYASYLLHIGIKAPLAFVRGIHQWPVNSPHKGPATRKMFPFDDVIMHSFCIDEATMDDKNTPIYLTLIAFSSAYIITFTCVDNCGRVDHEVLHNTSHRICPCFGTLYFYMYGMSS